jgi:hypothetical protein
MLTLLSCASAAYAQKHPLIFDVSEVVVGAKRIPTTYLYAAGQWSDADEIENAMSVQIHCYKDLGFCSVAQALVTGKGPGGVGVEFDDFDILRWDEQEMIAVDSSSVCAVNTIRADFTAKTMTISAAKKATESADKDPYCKFVDQSTAFLIDLFHKHDVAGDKTVQGAKQKKP